MTAVALVALLLLVLLNGLFVAAEFALVRSSRGRLEALAKDGKAGSRRGARATREARRGAGRLPARHHDGVDRHRLPGRARDRRAPGAGPRRLVRRPRRRARDLVRDRDRPSHHDRRAGAEDDGHNAGRSRRRASSRGRSTGSGSRPSPSPGLSTAPRTGSSGSSASIRRAWRRSTRPRTSRASSATRPAAARSTRARRSCSAASSTCTSRRRARS